MIIVLILLIMILIVGLFFYGTYFGLLTYKELILKTLAGVDARLMSRQKAVITFIDAAQDIMVKEEALIYKIRKIIIDINQLPKRWNNNEDRFKLENQLDIELNTLFTEALKYPNIQNNVYLNKYLQDFINIQTLLTPAVKEFNQTLRTYKSLINSPIGQILAPKMHIQCSFVEYYIPQ